MDVTVRFLRVESKEDIACTARLAHEIWNEHYVSIIGQGQVDYMVTKFQSEQAIAQQIAEAYEYYLIEHDQTLAGYLAVQPQPDTSRMFLSKIYIKKSFRGLGLGKAAVEYAEKLCLDSNLTTLWLTVNKNNSHSINWYHRMGFTNAGPVVMDIGAGFIMDDYKMEKTI